MAPGLNVPEDAKVFLLFDIKRPLNPFIEARRNNSVIAPRSHFDTSVLGVRINIPVIAVRVASIPVLRIEKRKTKARIRLEL
jgi:hypothetical protein